MNKLKIQVCTPGGCINALFDRESSDEDILGAIERRFEALAGGTPMYDYERQAVRDKIAAARRED